MEIKRTTEIFIETNRRFVVRQTEAGEPIVCPQCGEQMAGVEAAALFGINHRTVFRLVEQNAVHFAETETGAVLICLTSLAAVLESGAKQLPEKAAE